MEEKPKRPRRTPRTFTPEFRAEAVRLVGIEDPQDLIEDLVEQGRSLACQGGSARHGDNPVYIFPTYPT
jgi:hypothetical protein